MGSVKHFPFSGEFWANTRFNLPVGRRNLVEQGTAVCGIFEGDKVGSQFRADIINLVSLKYVKMFYVMLY